MKSRECTCSVIMKHKVVMMKNVLILFFCISIISAKAFAGSGNAEANKRPNIIIILSDDQGYGDLSCHGNPVLQTPALDKLYRESVRFSDFHVAPQCTPSRGQLLSGLDALNNKASSVGAGRGIMRQDIITMPEVFRQNGYRTGIFGKWHLGDIYPDRPMDRGFEKNIWFKGWGLLSETEYNNDYYKTRYLDSLKFVKSDKYCTNLWFDEAIKWMDEKSAKQEPFFTYISLNVTHGPFHALKEDADFYKDKVDKPTANFFGMIRNMDQNVERLDKWLEEKKLKDNTIVIFMTDNGGTGGVKFYNAGMRNKKESNYEGGHRVPLFIRWPKEQLGKPRTITYASQVQDLLPTFIDLLDLKLSQKHEFDGESLKPVLKQQKKLKDRMFVVQYGGNKQPEKYFSCVVWNRWRLVGENELYDLRKDPGQIQNVADKHPKELKKMRAFYENWWTKVKPGLDTLNHLVIDTDKENPIVLSSNDWAEGYINTQWAVAQASGDPKGGPWHIFVKQGGKYQLELSRWPFHLNRALTVAGPNKAVGGTALRTGEAVPVALGSVSLNNHTPLVVNANPNATKITVDMDINAGKNILQAWFKDKDGNDLCGSYFVRIKKIEN